MHACGRAGLREEAVGVLAKLGVKVWEARVHVRRCRRLEPRHQIVTAAMFKDWCEGTRLLHVLLLSTKVIVDPERKEERASGEAEACRVVRTKFHPRLRFSLR